LCIPWEKVGKKLGFIFTYFLKNVSKVKNNPIGENSPDLVTLHENDGRMEDHNNSITVTGY
jgi:hypothetical protein